MINSAGKAIARAGFARAVELDQQIRARYPGVWRQLDRFRADPSVEWPDWCLLPMAASVAVVTNSSPLYRTSDIPPSKQHVAVLSAMYAWRFSRSVFIVHPKLASQLAGETTDDLSNLADFTSLPNWCTYLPAANPQQSGLGVWAHLEYAPTTGRPELRLLLDFGGSLGDLQPIRVRLDGSTVTEALADLPGPATLPAGGPTQVDPDVRGASLAERVKGLITILAYLAHPEADIVNASRPTITPQRYRSAPPGRSIWAVGYHSRTTS
ncbi:hypothetical protein [Actinoplanes flavus]|uniref:Uncharacterized protein n=1 Tax=Actinoplanes flavus TaxID=2820290 RepID=A0ABS3UZZ3_9ACTN|nr:hypothetical protein [Actinoplanes flavus]MBO3744148.1 hypothetical protein [Actinoplanes flavus]